MVDSNIQKFFIILAANFIVGIYSGLCGDVFGAIVACIAITIFSGAFFAKKHWELVTLTLFFLIAFFIGWNDSLMKLEQKLQPIYDKLLYLELNVDKKTIKEYDEYYTFIGKLTANTNDSKLHLINDFKVKVYLPKKHIQKFSMHNIDKLAFKGKISRFESFNNPSNMDYHKRNLLKNIIGKVRVDNADINFKNSSSEFKLNYFSILVDKYFAKLEDFLPENQIAILKTLVVRPDANLSGEIYRDFSKTGLIHILCISGTHLSIISFTLYHILEQIFSSQIIPACLTLLISWLYVSITNMDTPILRALFLNTLLILGIIIKRKAFLPTTFAFVTVIFLAYKPLFMLDITFQLSFLATASLIFLYPHLENFNEIIGCEKFFWAPIAAILSVQILILPIILSNFHQISLTLFFSNFILLPILQISIVFIFFTSFLFYLLYPLGKVLIIVISIILSIVINFNSILAGITMLNIYTGDIPKFLYLIYYLAVIGFTVKTPNVIFAQFSKIIFVIILLSMLFCSYRRDGFAQMHFIDVAQGDACLIISKNKRSILIDTGGLEYSKLDIGEEVIVPYLRYHGIESVDYLLLSHNHYDHVGGSFALAKEIPIQNIILANEASRDNDFIKRLLLFSPKAKVVIPENNQKFVLDNLNFEFLHCPANETKDENDSLVLKIFFDKYKLLFTGDISSELEQNLKLNKERINVLKVAHHGSRNSTSEYLLNTTHPQVAVISAGRRNPFGHPHQETLTRLSLINSKIYRTDLNGAITISFDNERMTVNKYLNY